jgi:tRNA pseudouridine55 synthase
MDGFLNVLKPPGMSSGTAVAIVKRMTGEKVGHAGTLDPLATGVLVLCTGKKTKEIERLQYDTKEYTATLQLGATTPSYDMEHEVDQTYPTAHITEQLLRSVLADFVGEIQQVPPQYSAVKIGGKRAYELKRKGDEVTLASKSVRIDEMELTAYDATTLQASIRVVCGKGTYIRSLARDIGEALGSGAYLTALCRTRVGDVRLADCVTIDDFSQWLDAQEIETS